MALTRIMGQNFRAFVGATSGTTAAVVESTSVSATISGNMEDGSTQDTDNAWQQETMVSKQWQVQVDSLEATLASLRAIITQFNSDSKLWVGFSQTEGDNNRTPKTADFNRSGQAILNDLSIQANNRSNIQVTAQYQGSGPLA